MKNLSSGKLVLDPDIAAETQIGSAIDRIARARMRRWVISELGDEGPEALIRVNRRLLDPAGSGSYRIPDVRSPSHIFDLTIGNKALGNPQIDDFINFSGGSRITIVRPTELGGSYSIAWSK